MCEKCVARGAEVGDHLFAENRPIVVLEVDKGSVEPGTENEELTWYIVEDYNTGKWKRVRGPLMTRFAEECPERIATKVREDMDELAFEMELHELLGSRVHVHMVEPEFWFQGVLFATPSGDYEVVRVMIGGRAGGSYDFEFSRVVSIQGKVIVLEPEPPEEETTEDDACPDCGENRLNMLVWINDVSIRCSRCGCEYRTDAEELRLAELRWKLNGMVGFKSLLVIERDGERTIKANFEQLLSLRHAKDMWVVRNGCVGKIVDLSEVETADREAMRIYVKRGWFESVVYGNQ